MSPTTNVPTFASPYDALPFFCADTDCPTSWMRATFRSGDNVVATNGHVFAFLPVRADDPIIAVAPPCQRLIADVLGAAVLPRPGFVDVVTGEVTGRCDTCRSHGVMPTEIDCDACDADGVCDHCGAKCGRCHGRGLIACHPTEVGRPCATCHGYGRWRNRWTDPAGVEVDGIRISWAYAGLLALMADRFGQPLALGSIRMSNIDTTNPRPALAFAVGDLRGLVAGLSETKARYLVVP